MRAHRTDRPTQTEIHKSAGCPNIRTPYTPCTRYMLHTCYCVCKPIKTQKRKHTHTRSLRDLFSSASRSAHARKTFTARLRRMTTHPIATCSRTIGGRAVRPPRPLCVPSMAHCVRVPCSGLSLAEGDCTTGLAGAPLSSFAVAIIHTDVAHYF